MGASTFRQLNLATSLYNVVSGLALWFLWQGGVPVLAPMMSAILGMAVATVALCDWLYLTAKK